MKKASEDQNYELAAQLRDDVFALEKVLEKSTLVFDDKTDADLISIARDELSAAVSVFFIRGGRIRGNRSMVVDLELDRSNSELMEYVIQELYTPSKSSQHLEVPKQLLVSTKPNDAKELERWLGELRGSKVEVLNPTRGDKAKLLETAGTNANHALSSYKLKRSADFTARADALGDPAQPKDEECSTSNRVL